MRSHIGMENHIVSAVRERRTFCKFYISIKIFINLIDLFQGERGEQGDKGARGFKGDMGERGIKVKYATCL